MGRLRGSFDYELDTKRSDVRKVCGDTSKYEPISRLFAALALGLVRHSALLPVGASLWLLRVASQAHKEWSRLARHRSFKWPPGGAGDVSMSPRHRQSVSTVTGRLVPVGISKVSFASYRGWLTRGRVGAHGRLAAPQSGFSVHRQTGCHFDATYRNARMAPAASPNTFKTRRPDCDISH